MLFSATNSGSPMINIMKPTEKSELILNGSCIAFTEHTPTGDFTRSGKITSIQEIGDSVINYIDMDTNMPNTIGIGVTTYKQNGNDWSTIRRIECPSSEASSKASSEASTTKGGKRRRRTRQARRRKNRRTHSRK
jgi:hypothetical protein